MTMIAFVIYTAAVWIAAIFAWPVSWLMTLTGRHSLFSRFHAPKGLSADGVKRYWIHAASVGESGIAFSLAQKLHARYPTSRLFVSTITTTGLKLLAAANESGASKPIDAAFLAPFDHPVITARFLDAIRPTTFILVETEIWPWMLRRLHERNIPVAVVNGRLGRRSFRRYILLGNFIRRLVAGFSLVCVQNRSFAKRFGILGVPHDRLAIIGNVKFDGLPVPEDFKRSDIREEFGVPDDAPLFVAGSTRPGEEKAVAAAFNDIARVIPTALLIVAPRHLNRLTEVESILRDAGLSFVHRSKGETFKEKGARVLILDTLGELVRTFAAADAAFVGGSLADFGGHNPLEPAAVGVPVVFGQYMEQTGSRELLSAGAAVLVDNAKELAEAVIAIFSESDRKKRMSEAGPAVVARYRGTLDRTLRLMDERGLL